ncbi:aminotransferase class-I, partial [Pseudocercospora fijiensis CIRAD86]
EAVARFINHGFKPATPVDSKQILVTNGASSSIDLVAFNLCDPGEGVIVLTPTYMMFKHDLCARTGIEFIAVSADVDDQFSARYAPQLAKLLEGAIVESQRRGIPVKALLVCNPCNPVGRCYSKTTLTYLARLCGSHGMHLVSDEIYAMSCFASLEPGLDEFSSVLSIPEDLSNNVLAENIHCIYGASKDFGAGGLRLGFFVTRNELLWKVCRRLALFTWVTSFSTAFFEHFLSDQCAMTAYLDLYHVRLRARYLQVTELLREHGIPFVSANSGIFLLVKLTKWLEFLDSSHPKLSREEQLCRHLAYNGGVFMSPGEVRYVQAFHTHTPLPILN